MELNDLYSNGSDPEAWGRENAPDENLIYKSGSEQPAPKDQSFG